MQQPVITKIEYLADQETIQVFAQVSVEAENILVADLWQAEASIHLYESEQGASMISFALPIAEIEESVIYQVRIKEVNPLDTASESDYSDFKQIVTSLPVITKVESSYYNETKAKVEVSFQIYSFLEDAHGIILQSLKGNNQPYQMSKMSGSNLDSWASEDSYMLTQYVDRRYYVEKMALTITNKIANPEPDSFSPTTKAPVFYEPPTVQQITYQAGAIEIECSNKYQQLQVKIIPPDDPEETLTELQSVVNGLVTIPIELADDPTTYQVKVAGASDANNILNVGYYSAPYPIEMIAQDPVIPVINDVNYDGEFLTVACTADGYPLGVLQVVSGAGQIIHMTPPTPIQQIVIPVQLADTVSYSIKIKVCIDNYDLTQFGDWSDSVNLITQAPRVESVGYEKNDSNEWKLQTIFQKTGYAADYEVSIYLDDLLVEIPDEAIGMSIISGLDIVECVIIYPLDATKVYQLRIRGINRYNRTLIGPYSEAIELITAAPVITTVRYDDYNEMLGVAWKPCLQSTITGYQVILYENGSSDSLHAATNDSTEFYASLKKDEEYTVTVKAISNKATGPQSSSVNPVDTEAVFNVLLSYDDLMIRRSDTKRNTNFQLQLQQLFKAPPSDLTILANPNDPKSPFVLTQTDGAYFEYYLDVGENSNVWENPVDNEKIRGALQTNYIDFLTTLEQVSGGLVPGTIPYLQQIIGRGFQLTFDESLYYAYGFDANNRYCDLRAGMRVRIDYEQYQFAGPNSSELQNGMVGNGTSYYDINAYLSNEDPTTQVLNLGFDAFLSQLNFTIPELRGGGAGMLDTYFASMRKPYLRIFYPQNFGTPNGAGEANALKNIALVAANTFTQMENATQLFITSGVAAFPPDVEVMYFRGRVAIIPEIQVNVNQQSLYVPVGTTLRQLLQRFINLPSRHAGPKIYLNFTFTRGTENVALQGETELVLPHNLALNLNNLFQDTYLSINQQPNGIETLDLPLLHGDAINWL